MIYLAALLVVAYAVSAALGGAWWDIPATELLTQGASYGPAVAAGESWRLVSAQFLHGGLLHLLFNGFALLEVGRPVERQIGRWPTLGIFLVAGAGGFLASLLWHPESISIGASGGIFGLLGCWAMLAWRSRAGTTDRAGTLQAPTRRGVIVVAVVLAVGSGFLIANVDHAAHLGGLLAGLAIGGLAQRTERHWLIFFASIGLLAGLLLTAPRLLPEALQIEHREIREYSVVYRAFAAEERAINQRLQGLGEASQRHQLTDREGLDRLDREVLPRLLAQQARMGARTWQTPRIATDAALWVEYAGLRLAAVQALRLAVVSNDPEVSRVEIERFERLMTQAARLARPEAAQNASPAIPTPR